jgi:hypothetical protein
MSKGAFRILLAAYFLFDVVVSLYHSFFGMRVPTSIVHELYIMFGEPVPIPQPLAFTLGVIGVVLFVWAALGLFFFWRGARVVFVLLLVLFAAIVPLKPFYIISGWFEMFMHLRLLFHGFIICLIYFGSPREYFADRLPNQSLEPTAGRRNEKLKDEL